MRKAKVRAPFVRRANFKTGKIEDLESSVHYWWWRFLKKNEKYLKCCEKNGKGELADLYRDFGDVRGDDYAAWSKEKVEEDLSRYAYLFLERVEENERDPLVTLSSTDEWDQHYVDHGYLLVAINMKVNSRADLIRYFKTWMKNEKSSPNYLSDEERKLLIERRLYYWAKNKKGVLVRKRRAKSKVITKVGILRKRDMTGKRGRPDLANKGKARYKLSQAYSTPSLKRVMETYEAVVLAHEQDILRREYKAEAIKVYHEIIKMERYVQHRLRVDDKKDNIRVFTKIDNLYQRARELLNLLLIENDRKNLSDENSVKRLLHDQLKKRRNKEKTPYWKIGEILEVKWRARDKGLKRDQSERADLRDHNDLTKMVSRLYQRALKLIDGTAKGEFPT